MNNFLVLGLPRSRTAWLANFLSYDEMTCTHEGINSYRTLEEYRNSFTPNMGDANTGLCLFNFERYFTDFKIVIIEREVGHSIQFAKKMFGLESDVAMTTIHDRLKRLRGLHIPFEDINSRLEEIWDYVSPAQFNEKRAKMLIGFDVQVRDVFGYDVDAMKAIFANEKSS